MSQEITELLEVQTAGEATTVTIDGNAADVDVGKNGQDGLIVVSDGSGTERVRIDADTGEVVLAAADGTEGIRLASDDRDLVVEDDSGIEILSFDGSAAHLRIGADGTNGELTLVDDDGNDAIRADSATAALVIGGNATDGEFRVIENGDQSLEFGDNEGWLTLGGENTEGDLEILHNGDRALFLSSFQSNLRVGGDEKEGGFEVVDNGDQALDFRGDWAWLEVGGSNKEGEIEIIDNGKTAFLLDGENSKLTVGGDQKEGDIEAFDSGDKALDFRSDWAWLKVGGPNKEGDISVTDGDGEDVIHLDGERGDIILSNADAAEDFEVVADDRSMAEPGTVMTIDATGALRIAREPYDQRVAGVVSGAGDLQPGLVLGRDERTSSDAEKPVALDGRVNCKVDATDDAIAVGDLLTTSETPGYAMRVDDPDEAFGAVIGKALEPLEEGMGTVPILVALQ
jgi:hypothetical protein